MNVRSRRILAVILALAGLAVLTIYAIAFLFVSRGNNRVPSQHLAGNVVVDSPPVAPPTDKHEQLFVRVRTPVTMPDDLTATI
jgi:hypothetical protein